MDIECLVVSGEWKCHDNGQWDFNINQEKKCRVVHFSESNSLSEVSTLVLSYFGVSNTTSSVTLSYLSPDLINLGIGKKTPSVIIATDPCLRTCCRHLLGNRLRNIYVSFVPIEVQPTYITPSVGQKRHLPNSVGGCSLDCHSAPNTSSCLDHEFIEAVEAVEEIMRTSSNQPVPRAPDSPSPNDEPDSDSSGDTINVADVPSRGYDRQFWDPLLDDTFGGSNAVDIIFENEPSLIGRNLSEEFNNVQDTPVILNPPQSAGKDTNVVHGNSSSNERSVGESSGGVEAQDSDDADIPPLFDDTLYKKSAIPDLDLDEGDDNISVGRIFVNKEECQIALAINAIRNMFYFKQRRTTKTNFVVTCSDLNCRWMVNAHKLKENDCYWIKTASLEHTCTMDTKSKFPKMATHKVISHVFKSKFSLSDTGPRPKNIQQLVLEELGVSTTYSKCWRANQNANDSIRGTEEESYLKVEEYLHLLTLANPGSITDLKTVTDEQGVEKFMYLFLAFGASINGFTYLRPVLVLDGTHLTGKYRGILLTASGQDANFQVFPLAFAVVDAENDASWEWFLSKVKEIIPATTSLSIISDRHQSIIKAIKSVFKSAHHGACIAHLARNVVSRFKSKGLAKMVTGAACAYRIKHFKYLFGNIKKLSPSCAKFLEELGFQHWTRAYFKGNRYNLMTSNIAESLNNALRKARRSTIIELLMFIQSMMMRWFNTRRDKAVSHLGFTTPEVDKIITSNLKFAKGSKVTNSSTYTSEVVGKFGEHEFVSLEDKSCTCKRYDVLKIPCAHALLAAGFKGLTYGPYVGDHYRSSIWEKTYAGIIKTNQDPGDVDIPTEIQQRAIQPPRAKRPCGRPRVNRLLSTGEFPDVKNQRKCGRCGGLGHNKTSCKNPIG